MNEGDAILCKVKKVTNTVTFVILPNGREGTIVSSEIASGRIKLMRQYVVPNKQIVCKILRIDGDHVHLSLRRVNSKEKKDVLKTFKRLQAIETAFKQILEDKKDSIEEKILKDFKNLTEFTDTIQTNESLLAKYIPEEKQNAIKKLSEKRGETAILKQNIKIKCLENDGIKRIKKIFETNDDQISITYISAGNFKLKLITKDFKQGKNQMTKIIEQLEKKAKENNCEFYATEER